VTEMGVLLRLRLLLGLQRLLRGGGRLSLGFRLRIAPLLVRSSWTTCSRAAG
jgi:hypothetical protein